MKKIIGYGFIIIVISIVAGGFFSFSTNNVLAGNCIAPNVHLGDDDFCYPPVSGSAGTGKIVTGSAGLNVTKQLENPIKCGEAGTECTFSTFVQAVIEAAVEILMLFVVLAFVYSGFLFVKAQGKVEELETAKKAIYWTVIGAFILLGAWGFAQIIGDTVSTITETG